MGCGSGHDDVQSYGVSSSLCMCAFSLRQAECIYKAGGLG